MTNVKFYVSYFNNIRNLKSNCLPVSTAVWDPKWFHHADSSVYKDKNGVINGVRLEMLHPELDNNSCIDCDHSQHGDCIFTKRYRNQLDKIDFNNFVDSCKKLILSLVDSKTIEPINNEVDFILLVHEAPDNPCSERHVLRRWFEEHEMSLDEYFHGTSKKF